MNKQVLAILISAASFTGCKKNNAAQSVKLINPTEITYSVQSESIKDSDSINYIAYTPEEFYEKHSNRNVYHQNGWLENYKIMNPLLGLIAADTMIQKITEKKAGFQKKFIEYLR